MSGVCWYYFPVLRIWNRHRILSDPDLCGRMRIRRLGPDPDKKLSWAREKFATNNLFLEKWKKSVKTKIYQQRRLKGTFSRKGEIAF
jgi:hypothetical protein